LGETLSPDDEERAVRDFVATCQDITWKQLFTQVETIIARVRDALTLLRNTNIIPSTVAAEEKIEGRIKMVQDLLTLARAFCEEFSDNENSSYSEAFFYAINQVHT
jgi:hypothetical protein